MDYELECEYQLDCVDYQLDCVDFPLDCVDYQLAVSTIIKTV